MWKKKKIRSENYLLVLILGLFTVANLGLTQTNAASLETTTTLLANKGASGPGDIIHFSIWTYTGYDSVPFGQILLTDILTGVFIEMTIINGTTEVDWIVPSLIQSEEHIFLAEYLGFPGYLPSNGSCSVFFEEISPGSTRSTSVQLSINSTTVYKNAAIHFTLSLFIHYRWWFQGGFITVTSVNLSSSPVIWTVGPLDNYYPGTDPAILIFEFDYEIPIFSSIGKSQFYANYTGSSQSQTTPCTSNLVNLTVLSAGFSLYQTLNATKLQRVEESVLINTTVLGDNPNGLTLSLYYQIEAQPILLAEKILSDRNYEIVFSPDSSIPLGDLIIYTELKNGQDQLYANISSFITIQDRARIQYYLNSSEYRQNETIHLEAYITLEDIHTVPLVCQVELKDLTDGNTSLMNKSTNINGFVTFTYSLPENITIGNHEFLLRLFDVEPNILRISSIVTVRIKGLIDFDLTYESGGIQRNTHTLIQITVLSGGIVINEGLVSFMYTNSTIIDTQNCIAGLVFDYYIDNNHPLGDTEFLISFHGSVNYDEGIITFKLTVFSVPHFDLLNQNTTELVKGQKGRFWGNLLEEDGEAVINEVIHFTDTTTGEYLGVAQSNAEGLFFFDYSVPEGSQIGVHILQCRFQGNMGTFYLQAASPAIFSVTIRPPLSLLVEKSLLVNHWSLIKIEGGLNEEISLYWQRDGSTIWEFIAIVTLDASGIGNYNWTTPYYKGGLSLRASNLNSTNLKYDHAFMYSIADIEVIGKEFGNANDNYLFTVNCTEFYQIWIDDQLWKDWTPAGMHSYSYIFTSKGIKEISIISNETYVYYRILSHEVTIFEDLFIIVSIPQEALVNMSINIDGTILGEVSGPISGVDTILLVNGIISGVDSTNGAGIFDFLTSLNQPGIYTIVVQVFVNLENFYNTSTSTEYSVIVHSLPSTLEILSPTNNSVHGSILEVSFRGDAANYWYIIEPLDQMNISWTGTVYRELPEGVYTCHLYGENSYGIISFISSSFRIDSTAPSLVILSPKNESYNTNSILLSYLTNDEEVFIFLDASPIVGSSGLSLTDLSEGNHNLTVQVRDDVGNSIVKSSIFKIDTIVPYLNINSPYNYSYIQTVPLSFNSDGDSILYCIPSVLSTNQTYTSSTYLDLPLGSYSLYIYSFDSAGNVATDHISFSVVEKIELIINSHLTGLDAAGNYLLSTEILSNTYFNQVGIYINGSYFGQLKWDVFYQDYQIAFQLPFPGIWEIYLYANTIDERYDIQIFHVQWSPPNPIIISLSISWKGYYELRTSIDSQSLILGLVQVTMADTNYSLNNVYGDQWYTQIYCDPQNYSLSLNIWYPWDNKPSASKKYNITWYAPQITVVDSYFERNGFNLEIRVEKVNASLADHDLTLLIESENQDYSVNGNLIYESTIGSYQIWQFTSPWLVPNVWNYSLSVFDIYGHSNQFFSLFNSTDFPPSIGATSLILLDNTTLGVLYRLVVEVMDDYSIDEAVLYINGVEYPFTQINNSHMMLDFFLTSGTYILQILVVDDINQETNKFITNLYIHTSSTQTTTTELIDGTTKFSQTSQKDTQQEISSQNVLSDLIEVGLGTSLFATIAALGNSILRRKEQ